MVKSAWVAIYIFFIYFSTVPWTALAEVKETQQAQCTLISGDVKASAEASVSRKLEGFCATDHLSRALGNLEGRLLNEINYLRTMINMLLPPLYQQHYFAQPSPQLYEPLPSTTPIPQSVDIGTIKSSNETIETLPSHEAENQVQAETVSPLVVSSTPTIFKNSKESTLSDEGVTETVTEKQLKFRPVQKKNNERSKPLPRPKTGPREYEIHKFNNTILSGTDLEMFTYYWKIEQFSVKLKSNISTLTSPIFSIAGLNLQVRASFNHLGRDYLNLQIEQVDDGREKSNIILKAGDLFRKIQSNISFKHKIAILHQVTPTNDLISPEFANTNQGFLVPNSAILSGPFAKGDNLLIKVVMNI